MMLGWSRGGKMAEDEHSPETQPLNREGEDKDAPSHEPPPEIPEKTWEDILEEDRFQSTDN